MTTDLRTSLLSAAINCEHLIDSDRVMLLRGREKQGNALSQLGDRLEAAALAAAPSTSPAAAAQTVEVPEGLARSDAEFWLRNRSKIISAIADEGYTLMSNALGFSLMKLGKVTAQSAPAASAVAVEDVIGAMAYRGNTVSFMYDRAKAYGDEITRCWDVLREAGIAVAGKPLHEVLKAALATPHPSPSAAEQAGRWAPIKVAYSGGHKMVGPGARWRDRLTGSEWDVVEPGDGVVYSPSGLGGTLCFWCRPVGEVPDTAKRWLDTARADGCVSFCGDSIAAGMLPAAPSASPAEAPADQSPDDLRARFDAWLKTTPDWAPEYEQHRAWVELFAWWAVHALAAHPQPVAPAGQAGLTIDTPDTLMAGQSQAFCESFRPGRIHISTPAGQAAAGVQGENPNRNDPVSALAIRAIVAKGYCTQEQANECFSLACDALEAEAARMNEELPWVTRVPAPAVERGVAEELADFKKWKEDKGKSCHSGRFTPSPMEAWLARAALSTAGKEQA